ncbi:DinB family protein [Pseudogracilibacillus auburnensis]|uniref:DinB family protein n=1 Tax=Pseudogracilibacillus auburnensis TaxID=1494959 RepID=UPI0013143B2B|nr:DinB family protein [Pseudogracilibacillus auburnensis]
MKNNEKARIDLLKEVEGITKEMLHKKPGEDQWSINQIIEHLYLMEISIVRSMEKELVNARKTTVDDKPIHLTVNRKYKVLHPRLYSRAKHFNH